MIKVITIAAASAAFALLAVTVGRDGYAQGTVPSNDNFDRSAVVELGSSPSGAGYADVVDTTNATLEADEPTCVSGGAATVWYFYTPRVSNDLVIDTAGSDFSTFVAVYRITDMVPSPPGGSLEAIACTGSAGAQARLEFRASTGRGDYAIQVGGVGGETGRLRVHVVCSPGGCAPPNDDIRTATRVSGTPYVQNGIDTIAAGVELAEPLPCGSVGRTVWYRFDTYESAGDVVAVVATSADFDPVIGAYKIDQTSGAPSPPGAFALLECLFEPDEDFPGLAITTEPFTSYYIQIGGADEAGGSLGVLVSCGETPCRFSAEVLEGIDTGVDQGVGAEVGTSAAGSTIIGPESGSGGYLRGAY
jgi:hypothetical protein